MSQNNEAYENFIKSKIRTILSRHKTGKLKMSDALKQIQNVSKRDDDINENQTHVLKVQILGDGDMPSKKRLKINGEKYTQLGYRDIMVKGDISNLNLNEIYSTKNKTEFFKIMSKLADDAEFMDWGDGIEADSYMKGFRIIETHDTTINTQAYDMMNAKLKNVASYKHENSRYIETKINDTAEFFRDLIKNDDKYQIYNSCWINAILNKFEHKFSQKRIYLTREKILNIIGRLDLLDKDETPLSINDVLPFFIKYKINLIVLDKMNNIIYNKHDTYNADKLHILVSGDHAILINQETRALSKIIKSDDYESEYIKYVSPYFPFVKNTDKSLKFIENYDDIIPYIIDNTKQLKKDKITNINFILKYNDIEQFLYYIVKLGYGPSVTRNFKGVQTVSLKFNNINITVKNQKLDTFEDNDILFKIEQHYKKYSDTFNDVYNKIVKRQYASYYSETELENTYKIGPSNICFKETNKTLHELDCNKFYPYYFSKIDKIPIFNYFDRYTHYNNETIEDLNIYVIKSSTLTLLTPAKYTRLYGFVLKQVNHKYKIIYVKKPSHILDVDFKKIIDELFMVNFCDDTQKNLLCAKNIINMILGIIEKKQNKKTTSIICKDINECCYYKHLYNGEVSVMHEKMNEKINLDQLSDDESDDETTTEINKEEYLYMVHIRDKAELINGLKYIKEIVYQLCSLQNYQLYERLINENINVYWLKTDAFYLDQKGFEIVQNWDIIGSEIGQYKIKQKDSREPSVHYEFVENELFKIEKSGFNNIEIKDEYDTNEIINIIKTSNLCIDGEGGVGKSHICKQLNNKLFICPGWELCYTHDEDFFINYCNDKDYKFKACTLHHLLGIGVCETEDKKESPMDVDEYDYLIFDEIFNYSVSMLQKIDNYIKQHDDKRCVLLGDVYQIPPINDRLDNINEDELAQYYEKCVSYITKNNITLKINKRAKDEETANKFKLLRTISTDKNSNIEDVLKQVNIKTVKNGYGNITTDKNITFYKKTAQSLGEYIHKKTFKEAYEKGVILKCNYHDVKSLNKVGCHTRLRLPTKMNFIIDEINDETVFLYSVFDKNKQFKIELKLKTIIEHFVYNYSITGNACQGFTLKGRYTVLDIKSPYVTRQWLYVALTRNPDLDNVFIYEQTPDEIKRMEIGQINRYFHEKINGYKQQDIKAGRMTKDEKKDDYIDIEWIFKKYHKCKTCPSCGEAFYYENSKTGLNSNFTIDRINNDEPHTKQNCHALCVQCNRTKK